MPRIADLHPDTAKTDTRNAHVIADAAHTLPHTLHAIDTDDDTAAEPGRLEVGGDSGFAGSAHLAAYAGIAPVTCRSGTSVEGEHPARTGNRKLERAFFLAAFAALSDPTSRSYHQRKRDEGKKHDAALVWLARRRCDVLSPCSATRPTTGAPTASPQKQPLDNPIGTPRTR